MPYTHTLIQRAYTLSQCMRDSIVREYSVQSNTAYKGNQLSQSV